MDVPPRIQPLDPQVVNQIAAGEVIERPASVVKELLDNALDAGATRIHVDVAGGGRDLIRVVDNGHGIRPDDLPLAFASHATSKLRQPEDLLAIRTMGFRGEALASIGSVAQVLLQSRRAADPVGAQLRCDGGRLTAPSPWNGQPGTRLEVRDLFFNLPARRAFLKSIGTEMGHISEMVIRLALARADVGIKLTHNDRDVYDLPGSSPLAQRLRLFFGKDIADQLLPVEASGGPARLTGFVCNPALDRGNARMQYLFVNGRWIRDRSLGHAIQEAFHGLLMTGRYAVAFLFLEVPPDQVDVNVHPTKAEVRFRDGQALYHFVRATLRSVLNQHELVPRLRVPVGAGYGPPPRPQPLPPQPWNLHGSANRIATLLPGPRGESRLPEPELPPIRSVQEIHAEENVGPAPGQVPPPPPLPGESKHQTAPPSPASGTPPIGNLPLKAIQLHNAYLVLETDEGMLVVDQHALHERILYEQLKARVREGPVEMQRLLIPEPVDLSREEAALLLEQREALLKVGMEVQDFGQGTVLVHGHPAALGRVPPGDLVRAVVQHLANSPKPPTAEQMQHDLLAMMACKAAVKAGDPLGPDEISALMQYRELIGDPHHCPHGRPTCLYFSKQELDRQFQRV